jgi:hypothetical protein
VIKHSYISYHETFISFTRSRKRGGRSVGILHSQTKATELYLLLVSKFNHITLKVNKIRLKGINWLCPTVLCMQSYWHTGPKFCCYITEQRCELLPKWHFHITSKKSKKNCHFSQGKYETGFKSFVEMFCITHTHTHTHTHKKGRLWLTELHVDK